MRERDQMTIDMVKNLALLLMEREPSLSMEQALSIVINSDTYQRLLDDRTRLYYQSPRYVFSFLDSELKTGSINGVRLTIVPHLARERIYNPYFSLWILGFTFS